MGSLAERAVIHFVRSASNQDISLVRCAPDTPKLMRRHSVQTSNKAFSLPSIYHFSVSIKIYPFVPPRLTHVVQKHLYEIHCVLGGVPLDKRYENQMPIV